MIVIDRLLVGGIKFVLGKIARAVDEEMNDETVYREELLAAEMKLELGEITEDDFREIEREMLDRIREIRVRQRGEPAAAGELKVTGIEATIHGDEP